MLLGLSLSLSNERRCAEPVSTHGPAPDITLILITGSRTCGAVLEPCLLDNTMWALGFPRSPAWVTTVSRAVLSPLFPLLSDGFFPEAQASLCSCASSVLASRPLSCMNPSPSLPPAPTLAGFSIASSLSPRCLQAPKSACSAADSQASHTGRLPVSGWGQPRVSSQPSTLPGSAFNPATPVPGVASACTLATRWL